MGSVGCYSPGPSHLPQSRLLHHHAPSQGKQGVKRPVPQFWENMWLRGIGQGWEWRVKLSCLLMTLLNSYGRCIDTGIKSSYQSLFPGPSRLSACSDEHLCPWTTSSGPFQSLCFLSRIPDWEPSCVCALLPVCCVSPSCALSGLLGSQIPAIHSSLWATWYHANHFFTPGFERCGASLDPHDFSTVWWL